MFTPNQKPETCFLNVHFNGLSHLYSFVKGEEERMSEQHPSLVHFTDFGSGDRGDLIFNHFVWYSNSFLPFIDLFSRLYACPRKKLRREFRAVEVWRNKVAAHPSLVNSGRKRAIVCPACDSLIKPARSGRL